MIWRYTISCSNEPDGHWARDQLSVTIRCRRGPRLRLNGRIIIQALISNNIDGSQQGNCTTQKWRRFRRLPLTNPEVHNPCTCICRAQELSEASELSRLGDIFRSQKREACGPVAARSAQKLASSNMFCRESFKTINLLGLAIHRLSPSILVKEFLRICFHSSGDQCNINETGRRKIHLPMYRKQCLATDGHS